MELVIMPVLAHLAMTRRAVESVFAQDIGPDVVLMASDNGSEDGCGPYLRSLENTIYVGYSRTRSLNVVWNKALSYAFDALRLPYALVLNNDVVIHPSTFRLLAADGGPFVTAVGSDQPVPDGELTVDPAARRPHPDFSCFLIRRECWQAVGPFDERFWAFASDLDMHLRMHAAGVEAISLQIPFFHESSGTLKYAGPELRERISKQAANDRRLFREKHGFEVGTPEYYARFAK